MTEPNRQSEENEERIIEIEIERLRPFKEHPFQVKDAEIMRGSSKDFVDDVIDREILNALIKELTERQKTVLNLVYFEEMRQQDVADYLGIKQQSVNDLLNRALKTMKKKAENEEF